MTIRMRSPLPNVSATGRMLRLLAALGALGLWLAACGPQSRPPAAQAPAHEGAAGDHGEVAGDFGVPGEVSESSRVIEITANDALQFVPAQVEVAVGETVTFRVTNVGAIAHDFTLGDEATQAEHEAEMATHAGQMPHSSPNSFIVQPGETKELVWRFTAPGEVLYGCHTPGHYAAGMKGLVTVK